MSTVAGAVKIPVPENKSQYEHSDSSCLLLTNDPIQHNTNGRPDTELELRNLDGEVMVTFY